MDSYGRGFVRASLVWLGVGVLIGAAMTIRPVPLLQYRPAHMHANLLGFVAMMIFGVAYHIMPRFNGRPLHSPAMARVHLALANAWSGNGSRLRITTTGPATTTCPVRAVRAVGAFLFIANIWITIRPAGIAPMPSPVTTSTERAP